MKYIIHYDIAALIVFISIGIGYYMSQKFPSRQAKRYEKLLVVSAVSVVLDLITVQCIAYAAVVPVWFNYIINILFYLTFNSVPLLYCLYIKEIVDGKQTKSGFEPMIIPYICIALMIATNGIHKQVFYFDAEHNYCHGYGYYVVYVVTFVYLILSLVLTISNRKKLIAIQKIATIIYNISSICVVLLQCIYDNLLISEFAVAISVLLMYMTLQNPLEFADARTGTFNREAFTKAVTERMFGRKRQTIIGVQLEGTQKIREFMDSSNELKILDEFGKFLKDTAGYKRVYKIADVQFAIVVEKDVEDIKNAILRWVDAPFEIDDLKINLWVSLCIVENTKKAEQNGDFLKLMDYWGARESNIEASRIIDNDKSVLEEIEYEYKLKHVLEKSISEQSFEVYYQPIYDWKNKKFAVVEALARMYDKNMGFISPDEFIIMAEKSGQIIKIGEMILRKVCSMIKEDNPMQYGVEKIHINLSVIQCMQENLAKDFTKIIDSYNISHDNICFEITETISSDMTDSIKKNLDYFINNGFEMSMDDYGTGYTNIMSIANYRYNSVKMDKSMVWTSMESDTVRVLLEQSISMFKMLDKKIVAEGVETKEQIEMLKQFGCDYFQGYYYSKPLKREDYISFMKKYGNIKEVDKN